MKSLPEIAQAKVKGSQREMSHEDTDTFEGENEREKDDDELWAELWAELRAIGAENRERVRGVCGLWMRGGEELRLGPGRREVRREGGWTAKCWEMLGDVLGRGGVGLE